MKKTIKVGEHEIMMESSGDIPRMYRKLFESDLIVQMGLFEQRIRKEGNTAMLTMAEVEMFENLAWCLAKHADPDLPDIDTWLRQFEPLDILNAVPDLLDIWVHENKTTSKLKKKNDKLTDK